jgi:predicted PurR-regulated permease PerM
MESARLVLKPIEPDAERAPNGVEAESGEAAAAWQQARATVRVLALILATIAAVCLAYALRSIVLLIVLSIFFAYLLAPLADRLHANGRRLGRGTAIAVLYLGLVAVAAGAGFLVVPRLGDQLATLGKAAPSYMALERQGARSLDGWYQRAHLSEATRAALDSARVRAVDALAHKLELVSSELLDGLRYLPFLVLIPVLAFFLLKDAELFRRAALAILPPGRARWRGGDFLDEVSSTLAFFIRAQLMACSFIGIVCTLGFVALGVPYALVLGGVAGLFEVVPVIGPAVTLVAALAFAGSRSLPTALATFCFLGSLRLVHDYLVYPRLIARGIKLHPLAIILAVLCGSTLSGLWGVFLAIPATAVCCISYRYLRLHLGTEGLVAELIRRETPSERPAIVVAAQAPDSAGKLGGLKVVLVDNDDDARQLLTIVLEREGAQAFGAASAAEAMLLLRSTRPHVLISDLAMPDEDGFDLMRQIRASTVLGEPLIPAVALTGYATEEDRARVLDAGFLLHVSKPVDPAELTSVVAALARR